MWFIPATEPLCVTLDKWLCGGMYEHSEQGHQKTPWSNQLINEYMSVYSSADGVFLISQLLGVGNPEELRQNVEIYENGMNTSLQKFSH